jgi:UDP-N-acetylglucosamine--N-acetylmuramyl-(pentapeptide) pyrophosphoryl-undecaprenol N-acetylglucosamine transferase
MERFFPADKIMMTGNPVRQALLECAISQQEAVGTMGLNPERPVVLIIGGSLGARTVNESVLEHLDDIANSNVQFVWQTGSYYYKDIQQTLKEKGCPANLKAMDFITDMGVAYKAADLVISRAGASSISELCLLGKPSILVPSPNVAEDHQTHNAMALVNRQAALMVKDADARQQLIPLAIKTLSDPAKGYVQLGANAKQMALPDSADIIADEVIKLAQGH